MQLSVLTIHFNFVRSGYTTLISSNAMEEEIYANGPITAAFTVYDDLLTYKSGIYQRSLTARPLGGHSIKILGTKMFIFRKFAQHQIYIH